MASRFDPAAHLPDDLIARIRSRARSIDAANEFPHDDLADLRGSGYLRVFLPQDRDGAALTIGEVSQLQRRLAGAAAATALAINMHLVWSAVAQRLRAQGRHDLSLLEDRVADGGVLAFGISEPRNDLVLFGSKTSATPTDDGGYTFTGTKIFTSLSPVWTTLGVHGLDVKSADAPKVVFALLTRDDSTITTADDWDTLGMRGTQSRTTTLTDARALPREVIARLDPGPSLHPVVLGIFAAFELLVSSVYVGIAERALAIAVGEVSARRSTQSGRPRTEDPETRHTIASAGIEIAGLDAQLQAIAADIDGGVDHGFGWFPRLSSLKYRATHGARRVVDQALTVAGGGAYRSSSELARLQRDVIAGIFHPSSDASAHQTMATAWLGPLPTA